MEGHAWWQWFSHTWYVWLTIIGSGIVLGMVYKNRWKPGRYDKQTDREKE